jgi:exopolysaccharide production protein ExoZ
MTGVIQPIQYLRALAALMVVWHHALIQLPGLEAMFPLRVGVYGVDLFFVVSGFIMAHTTKDDATPWQFMRRRLVRVVPLYWLMTGAVIVGAAIAPSLFRSTSLDASHVIQSLLFIQHESPSHAGKVWPVLVPGWSLNYEMAFYAAFAVSLWFPQRYAVLAAILGAMAATGTYIPLMLLEFMTGVIVAEVWSRAPVRWWPAWIAAGVGLMAASMPLGAALVVYGSLGLPWRSRVLRDLGDASYSIYLTHLVALGVLRVVWGKAGAGLWFMLACLVMSSVTGWLVYRLIERPLVRAFRDVGVKRRPATVPASDIESAR